MDEIMRDSVITFVVLFVAIGGLITFYALWVHRDERARKVPESITRRAACMATRDQL